MSKITFTAIASHSRNQRQLLRLLAVAAVHLIPKVARKATGNMTLWRLLVVLQSNMILSEERWILSAKPMLAVLNVFVCFALTIEEWNQLIPVYWEAFVVRFVFTMQNRCLLCVRKRENDSLILIYIFCMTNKSHQDAIYIIAVSLPQPLPTSAARIQWWGKCCALSAPLCRPNLHGNHRK